MIVADSSVLIAAFASWHEQHEPARRAVAAGPAVVAQSLLETYSVLTRLPEPHRIAGPDVARYLARQFSEPPMALGPEAQQALVGRMSAAAISGGAVYDALIAFTVEASDGTLLSLDVRAARTYARCGVRFEMLAR